MTHKLSLCHCKGNSHHRLQGRRLKVELTQPAIETEILQVNEIATTVNDLQVAQTTLQQSFNLLQAAHNALHESVGHPFSTGHGGATANL